MTRYVVVAYANYGKQLPVHHLLNFHTWEILTRGYVLVKADVEKHKLPALQSHPAAFVLPSLFSPLSVSSQATAQGKTAHWAALQASGVLATQTAPSIIIGAVAKHGLKFSIDL